MNKISTLDLAFFPSTFLNQNNEICTFTSVKKQKHGYLVEFDFYVPEKDSVFTFVPFVEEKGSTMKLSMNLVVLSKNKIPLFNPISIKDDDEKDTSIVKYSKSNIFQSLSDDKKQYKMELTIQIPIVWEKKIVIEDCPILSS